jgi:hypothetical protein
MSRVGVINWLQDQSKDLGMGIENASLCAAWRKHLKPRSRGGSTVRGA